MNKCMLIAALTVILADLVGAQGGFYEAYDYNRWLSEFAVNGALMATSGMQTVDGRGRELQADAVGPAQVNDLVLDVSYEGRHARWMLMAGGSIEMNTDAGALPELSSSRQVAEAAIGLMPIGEGFYIITGGRFNDAEIRVGDADLKSAASVSGGKQWLDPFAGMRLDLGLFDWLAIRLYGDVGGFGVGSNTSWKASTSLRWRLGGFVLQAGYEMSSVDFESDEEIPFRYDVVTKSPGVGLSYSF